MYDVTLHLGAHKTATSHFRNLLEQNLHLRSDHGLFVPPAIDIRKNISRNLPKNNSPNPSQNLPARIPPALTNGDNRIYLLDENILGEPKNLFGDGLMYPWAGQRVKGAVQHLTDCDLRIFVSIRNPATYVVSAYLEAVRNNGFRSFKGYLGGVPLTAISWITLINRLKSAAGEIPITVWKYEDYMALTPRLVALALGCKDLEPATIQPIKSVVRPSMSGRALAEIERENIQIKGRADIHRTKTILQKFSKRKGFEAPVLWSEAETVALAASYDSDVAKIAEMSGVTMLIPDQPKNETQRLL